MHDLKKVLIEVLLQNKVLIIICIVPMITTYSILIVLNFRRNNFDVPTYRAYFIDHEVVEMIQKHLEEAGFNFTIPTAQDSLKITTGRDSIGGLVSAEIILINEEKDMNIALVGRSQGVLESERGHISWLVRREFRSQYHIALESVFFNWGRSVWSLEEKLSYIEDIEQDICQQVQDFIEHLQSEPHPIFW